MVRRRDASASVRAAGVADWWAGKAARLDLLVGQLGRAQLAAAERRESKRYRKRAVGSTTALRVRRESLVLLRRGAAVRVRRPAHGHGRQEGTLEGADSWLRHGLRQRNRDRSIKSRTRRRVYSGSDPALARGH